MKYCSISDLRNDDRESIYSERRHCVICLLSQGEWLPFQNDAELVRYLAGKLVPTEGMPSSAMRRAVATLYRPAVQSRAISMFPLETITQLTSGMREVLHATEPVIDDWTALPPLAVIASDGRNIPVSAVLDGHETVWVIDWTSDETLLDSLDRYDAISIQRI